MLTQKVKDAINASFTKMNRANDSFDAAGVLTIFAQEAKIEKFDSTYWWSLQAVLETENGETKRGTLSVSNFLRKNFSEEDTDKWSDLRFRFGDHRDNFEEIEIASGEYTGCKTVRVTEDFSVDVVYGEVYRVNGGDRNGCTVEKKEMIYSEE